MVYRCTRKNPSLDLDSGKPASILGGEASNPWSDQWSLTNGFSKAGQALTPNTCYCSAYCQDAYANMDITPSAVTHVKLLNRVDGAGQYSGLFIFLHSDWVSSELSLNFLATYEIHGGEE